MMTAIIFLKGLPISTTKVKLIDNYNHQFLIALYSSTQFPVSVFQGSNCTAIAMYFNFSKKLNFTKVYVLFTSFFLHESQPAGPVIKTKKGQCRVKKSEITLALEIRSPQIKELVRNGGIIVDFNGVRKTLFNHQSQKYHQI